MYMNNQFMYSFVKAYIVSHILLQLGFKFKVFGCEWSFENSVEGTSRNVSYNTLRPVTWFFANVLSHVRPRITNASAAITITATAIIDIVFIIFSPFYITQYKHLPNIFSTESIPVFYNKQIWHH